MTMKTGKVYVIAEIGINHNGDLERAKKLIVGAKNAGADAVKFQKRTVSVVYTKQELDRFRDSPFGVTNGALKYGLEFGRKEYDAIDDYCKELNIDWFASPWDEDSVDFLVSYNPPYLKVASACLTDAGLLSAMSESGIPLLVSTGMADLETIRRAVSHISSEAGHIACLYHCTSTYPAKACHLNLKGILTLRDEFPSIPIGYSGHEMAVHTSAATVLYDVASVERHITLSKADWGSDQAASLDISGFTRLVRDIRILEEAKGDGHIVVYPDEVPIADKLRRKNTL